MSVLDSLPDRPLTGAELASFNRTDALDVAVDVSGADGAADDAVVGLLLATDEWVKGLAYADGGWRVVETVGLGAGENERFEGMQRCETAVRDALA